MHRPLRPWWWITPQEWLTTLQTTLCTTHLSRLTTHALSAAPVADRALDETSPRQSGEERGSAASNVLPAFDSGLTAAALRPQPSCGVCRALCCDGGSGDGGAFTPLAGEPAVGSPSPARPSRRAVRHSAIIGRHSSPSAVIDGHDPPRPVRLDAILPGNREKTITSCVYNECPQRKWGQPSLLLCRLIIAATQAQRWLSPFALPLACY